MEVGRDPYLVFVADAPDGRGDLFAARPDGHDVVQISFSPVDERAPALTPDGGVLAFLRAAAPADTAAPQIWLLNLLSGVEREVPLPRSRPHAVALGWGPDGRVLYVRAANGTVYRADAPPAAGPLRLVDAGERAAADSALAVLLGDPPFARAVPCAADAASLCLVGALAHESPLASSARGPIRWGADSVGYFTGETIEVRPLGPGRSRRLQWKPAPARPREAVVFMGSKEPAPP